MKKYILNTIRRKNFDDKILITNDYGTYQFLSKQEFDNLIKYEISDSLFAELESKGIIITKNNHEMIAEHFRLKKMFLFQGTSLHIVVPTLRCNQDCIYCHASKRSPTDKGFDMDEETAKKTVDFIFQTTSYHITIELQGGEPLLNWDIVKYMINYAHEKNKSAKKDLKLSIVTNLLYMTDDKLEFLIKKDVDICTSFDGPKELHNKNRPKNSYDTVVRWLKKIKSEYVKRKIQNHDINAVLTVTRYSLDRYKEIVDEYINLGLKNIHLRFLNYLGNAKDEWDKISYTPEEFIEFWIKSTEYIKKQNDKIRERTQYFLSIKVDSEYDPNYLEWRSPCGAVTGQLVYDYDGSIYTCDEGRMIGEDIFNVGSVYDSNYKELTTSNASCSIISASTNDLNVFCDNCVYKPYCGLCPVCNYGEQGNIIAKIPQTSRCKIFTAQFDYYFKEKLKNEKR